MGGQEIAVGVEGLLGEESEEVGALEQMAVLRSPTEGQLEQGSVGRQADGGPIGHGAMMIHDHDQAAAAAGIARELLDLERDLLEERGPGEIEQGAASQGAFLQRDPDRPQMRRPGEMPQHMVGALETAADVETMVAVGAAQELGRMDLSAYPESVERVEIGAHVEEPQARRAPMLMGNEKGAENEVARGGAGGAEVPAFVDVDKVHPSRMGRGEARTRQGTT